jgi:hypothetical protein
MDVSQWQPFWTTFNWNHNLKCGKSESFVSSPGIMETNDSQCLQRCQAVVYNVPANSVRQAQQEAHCSKICAKGDEQWSKGIMHCCLHQSENGPTLFPTSSLVMNLGCLGMTLRWSSSHLSGRLKLHHEPRKDKSGAMSNQCWFVFWHWRHCK